MDRYNLISFGSLFVLVFPGYGQQSVAFTHVNQELIPLLGYILSFGVTAWALRSKDKFIPLTLLNILISGVVLTLIAK